MKVHGLMSTPQLPTTSSATMLRLLGVRQHIAAVPSRSVAPATSWLRSFAAQGSASLNSFISDARTDANSNSAQQASRGAAEEDAASSDFRRVRTQQKYIRVSPRRLNLLCTQVRWCSLSHFVLRML